MQVMGPFPHRCGCIDSGHCDQDVIQVVTNEQRFGGDYMPVGGEARVSNAHEAAPLYQRRESRGGEVGAGVSPAPEIEKQGTSSVSPLSRRVLPVVDAVGRVAGIVVHGYTAGGKDSLVRCSQDTKSTVDRYASRS